MRKEIIVAVVAVALTLAGVFGGALVVDAVSAPMIGDSGMVRGPLVVQWFFYDYGPGNTVTVTAVVSNLSNRYVRGGEVELRVSSPTQGKHLRAPIAVEPLPDMNPGGAAIVRHAFAIPLLSAEQPDLFVDAKVYGQLEEATP